MQQLVSFVSDEPVTTSQVIALHTQLPHRSVVQLVRKYDRDLHRFGRVQFQMRPFETAGGTQQREVALLNERQSTLLISYMRNKPIVREFKMRLVQAFYELAEQQRSNAPVVPQTLAEALRLAADKAEEADRLALEAQQNAPKVEFHDRVVASEGSMSVAEAAKLIGTGRTRLFAWLRKAGWVTRRNEPYQSAIESGLLDVKLSQWEHPDKGIQETITARVTGKGLAKLRNEYGAGSVQAQLGVTS